MNKISITVNGKTVEVDEGTSVAAAVYMSGVQSFRQSVTGEHRGPICGMGICYECRCTINGQPHQRGCQHVCQPGMEVETE